MRPYQPSMLYPGIVSAPSSSDRLSSYSAERSKSVTEPMPSQRGHMPPSRVKVAFSVLVLPAPRSTVIAPLAFTDGTLNENALGEPMCGCPSRLKRMRSIALASVAVPTVERGLAPIRSWSRMIAVVSPSRTSTSGRARVGMKPCTKALYVSLISRCDSAAMVPNTSELLPEPETPVNTVSRRFGISTLRSLRLFTRAPCTRITSWLHLLGRTRPCSPLALSVGGVPISDQAEPSDQPAAVAHQLAVGQLVSLPPSLDAAQGDAEPAVRRGERTRVEASARCEPVPVLLRQRVDLEDLNYPLDHGH